VTTCVYLVNVLPCLDQTLIFVLTHVSETWTLFNILNIYIYIMHIYI